jgi:hypothetical protein
VTRSRARALRTLQEFLRLEVAGGLLLMAATVLAMIVANSPLARHYSTALDLLCLRLQRGSGVRRWGLDGRGRGARGGGARGRALVSLLLWNRSPPARSEMVI